MPIHIEFLDGTQHTFFNATCLEQTGSLTICRFFNRETLAILPVAIIKEWNELAVADDNIFERNCPSEYVSDKVKVAIKFIQIKDTPLFYVNHKFFGKFEDDKLVDYAKNMPYAVLAVRSHKYFPDGIVIPVINKVDFKNLWELNRKGYLDTQKNGIIITHTFQKGIEPPQ